MILSYCVIKKNFMYEKFDFSYFDVSLLFRGDVYALLSIFGSDSACHRMYGDYDHLRAYLA